MPEQQTINVPMNGQQDFDIMYEIIDGYTKHVGAQGAAKASYMLNKMNQAVQESKKPKEEKKKSK